MSWQDRAQLALTVVVLAAVLTTVALDWRLWRRLRRFLGSLGASPPATPAGASCPSCGSTEHRCGRAATMARGIELRLVSPAGDLFRANSLVMNVSAEMSIGPAAEEAWVNLVTLGRVTTDPQTGELAEGAGNPGMRGHMMSAGAPHICLGTVGIANYSLLIRPCRVPADFSDDPDLVEIEDDIWGGNP